MYRFEAYDMSYVDVSSCVPTKSTVCDATTTKVKASILTSTHPFEAYDMSRDEVSRCIPTKSAVYDETAAKVKA